MTHETQTLKHSIELLGKYITLESQEGKLFKIVGYDPCETNSVQKQVKNWRYIAREVDKDTLKTKTYLHNKTPYLRIQDKDLSEIRIASI